VSYINRVIIPKWMCGVITVLHNSTSFTDSNTMSCCSRLHFGKTRHSKAFHICNTHCSKYNNQSDYHCESGFPNNNVIEVTRERAAASNVGVRVLAESASRFIALPNQRRLCRRPTNTNQRRTTRRAPYLFFCEGNGQLVAIAADKSSTYPTL
jgi:hypothetical protein